MMVTPESAEQAATVETDIEEPDVFISVYGGKKDEVDKSFKRNLNIQGAHSYHTWISVSLLKRFGNFFSGSVESAAGVTDMLLVIAAAAIIVGFFFLWQFVIFFIVIFVLTLFSGGVVLKFVKGTFIETRSSELDPSSFDTFVQEQIKNGCFVNLRVPTDYSTKPFTGRAVRATKLFTGGIYLSLLVATLFTVMELLSFIFFQSWLTDVAILAAYGLSFLAGVFVMDIGILYRRHITSTLPHDIGG